MDLFAIECQDARGTLAALGRDHYPRLGVDVDVEPLAAQCTPVLARPQLHNVPPRTTSKYVASERKKRPPKGTAPAHWDADTVAAFLPRPPTTDSAGCGT